MADQIDNFSDTTPAAPSGGVNVKWQADAPSTDPTVVRNESAYVPISTSSAVLGLIKPDGTTVFVTGSGVLSTHPIPAGGGTGDVLTKNSAADYDVGWAVAGTGGTSGTTHSEPLCMNGEIVFLNDDCIVMVGVAN